MDIFEMEFNGIGTVRIAIDNVLLFYDIPIFFCSTSEDGYKLFYLYDSTYIKEKEMFKTEWIVSDICEEVLVKLKNKELSIYDALITKADTINYYKDSKLTELKDVNSLKYLEELRKTEVTL